MQRIHSRFVTRHSKPSRRGFTMIEAVVVTAILAVLIALIMPAVQQARTASRKLQCRNNLRNVALGLVAETESRKHFPASGYFGKFSGIYHSWVVTVLPWIDQSVVYNKYDLNQEFRAPGNLELCSLTIPVLICPEDTTARGSGGDLSYVVNGGYGWTGPPCGVITPSTYQPIDLNGSGSCLTNPKDGEPSDRVLWFQTGLMFCENWPEANNATKRHDLGSIKDGASQTLMLAENLHAGFDPDGNHGNWGNPNSWRTCFLLSGHICEGFSCSKLTVDLERANLRTAEPYKFEALNAPFQAEGAAPWPSSSHTGGLNAAFCDGSVRFLNENLNGRIYYQMVTPQGSLVTGPIGDGAPGEAAE